MKALAFRDYATVPVPECGQRLTGDRTLEPVTSHDVHFKPII